MVLLMGWTFLLQLKFAIFTEVELAFIFFVGLVCLQHLLFDQDLTLVKGWRILCLIR